MKRNWNPILKTIGIVVLVNLVSAYVHTRIDLTEDHRYTLSEPTKKIIDGFEDPVIVDILLSGKLPSEFERLKVETRQILEEFSQYNPNIKYNFINPLEDEASINGTITDLQAMGLTPTQVTVESGGKRSQEIIFPWAMVNHGQKTVKVALLKNKLGASQEELVNNSVRNLEYAFADALVKVGITDKKRVAIIKGNGELDDIHIADFLTSIRDYYNIGAITLDSVATNPQKTLDQLKGYDLAIVAKPTEAFTDGEKYVMDQFMVSGGRTLWLIDQVGMELDSLFNPEGKAMAMARDLNLRDLFFAYGIRLRPELVNDLYFTQIVLAAGDGSDSQYTPVPWYYNPMVFSRNDHPINNNLETLRFQFANAIDTLAGANSKTILLRSSPLSKLDGTPRPISLEMAETPPDKALYTHGNNALAVLVEGNFKSGFAQRIKPLQLSGTLEEGPENKMIVIADGDLIKNQIRNGRPLELGYDKWTNNFYGNKEFLVNCLNYLLDDTGLIQIRTKQVAIPFLDQEKVATQRTKWQLLNVGLPLGLTLLFGLLFQYLRKRRYAS